MEQILPETHQELCSRPRILGILVPLAAGKDVSLLPFDSLDASKGVQSQRVPS